MERYSCLKEKILVIVFNILIPLIFLIAAEFLTDYFNPAYKLLFSEKVINNPFAPLTLILFTLIGSITALVVHKQISPLYNFLEKGKNREKARKASLRVPWVILLVHFFAWSAGDFTFYLIVNFKAPNGVPFSWSMVSMMAAGMPAALCTVLAVNLVLNSLKIKLKMQQLRKKEKDYFSFFKDYIVIIILAYSSVAWISYAVYFYQRYSVHFQEKELTYWPLFFLALGIIFVDLLIAFFSKQEDRFQIKMLHKKLEDLNQSSGDINERVILTHFNEIGYACHLINSFLDKFSRIIDDLDQTSLSLNESTSSLSASSNQIAATSQQQATAVKEIIATMEDSGELVEDAESWANQIAEQAEDSQKMINNGQGLVKESAKQMQEIRQTNINTRERIEHLETEIINIQEIISGINKIADQTKIIAFNAELEASSAGEQGHNFEIVAGEIRRLADNIMQLTREIKSKISDINQESSALVSFSSETAEKIEEGWQISQKLNSVFDYIQEHSEQAVASSSGINEGMHQIVQGVNQVLITLKQISEGIDSLSQSTNSLNDSAIKMDSRAEGLNAIVKSYKQESSGK